MPQDEKIDMFDEKFEEDSPVLAASSSKGKKEGAETQDTEQQLGIPSSFFKQFHSPEKKREENAAACQALVLWKAPAPVASETTRPPLRRQMAKSSLDLDAEDMQTLALALQSKAQASLENDMHKEKASKASKMQQEKSKMKDLEKETPKDTASSSSTVKPKAKAGKTEKTSTTAVSKKCTFRHRKTSTAYHQGKKAAMKAGCSPNTAKAKGREASNAVSMQIDQGILKEDGEEYASSKGST